MFGMSNSNQWNCPQQILKIKPSKSWNFFYCACSPMSHTMLGIHIRRAMTFLAIGDHKFCYYRYLWKIITWLAVDVDMIVWRFGDIYRAERELLFNINEFSFPITVLNMMLSQAVKSLSISLIWSSALWTGSTSEMLQYDVTQYTYFYHVSPVVPYSRNYGTSPTITSLLFCIFFHIIDQIWSLKSV